MLAQSMLPPWLVVPPTLILVIAVGSHMIAMRSAAMPQSRRRIRTANGLLMLVTAPFTAFAFCWVSPDDPRAFVLTWTTVVALVGLVIALAVADILNNFWLAHQASREVRRRLREVQLALIEHARSRHAHGAPHPQPHPHPLRPGDPG